MFTAAKKATEIIYPTLNIVTGNIKSFIEILKNNVELNNIIDELKNTGDTAKRIPEDAPYIELLNKLHAMVAPLYFTVIKKPMPPFPMIIQYVNDVINGYEKLASYIREISEIFFKYHDKIMSLIPEQETKKIFETEYNKTKNIMKGGSKINRFRITY